MFKINRVQNLIADGIIFVLSLIIFYCGITSIGFSYFTTNILNDVVSNWKTHPLVDIKEGKGACAEGYEPLINGVWLGTVEGCDCSYNIFGSLTSGACTRKQHFCSTIKPIEPIELNAWDGVILCAKRHSKDYLYFLSQKMIGVDSCSMGTKWCGKLDNLNKNYCVEETDSCFINNISITSEAGGTGSDNTPNNNNSLNKIPLGYGKYLSFTSSETNPKVGVINQLKTSEGDVCIDPDELNTASTPYKLINDAKFSFYCTNSLDGQFHDDRFKLVDQTTLGDFYNDNKLIPVLNTLPQYTINKTAKVQLYSRGFIGWNQNCFYDDQLVPENVVLSSQKIVELLLYQSGVYYFSIFYLPLMVILIIAKINYVWYENNNLLASDALKKSEAANLLFVILAVIFSIVSTNIGSNLANFFIALKSSNCGDEITNQALFILGDKLHSNLAKNKTSMILYIITLIAIPTNIAIMQYRSPDTDMVEEDLNNYIKLDTIIKNENTDIDTDKKNKQKTEDGSLITTA